MSRTPNRRKVVAYLRVSTDRQAEEGLGLEVQADTIKTWAKANNTRIVDTFTDEGVSGSNGIDNREALPEAFDAIKSREAEGLVVYRLDRLARDLIIQETLLAEVRRLGGEVFSTSAAEAGYLTDDPDDPSRKLIRQVLGAVAEYERSMIALRLRSGRKRKAKDGGYAYGSPPFGYRVEDAELVPDEAEQATLVRARELREAGLSIRRVASALTEEGHRTKRGGTRWHPTTVARVLSRS